MTETNYQTNSNATVAYKKQTGRGAVASGAAAKLLRIAGGNGVKPSKATVASAEIRNDGLSTRGRHGSQSLTGDYNAEMSLGSHDPIVEAVMRSAWDSTNFSKAAADFTSVTTTANAIILDTGNPITMGFRVGDVIRGATFPDGANNGKNLRITGLSATTITVAETLIVNAAPNVAAVITRPGKRLINPPDLLKAYFTLEEFEADIGESTVAQDFVWSAIKLSMATNGLIMASPSGVGTGQVTAITDGSAPTFTNPVATTDAPMSVVDATIRLNGVDLVELSALSISLDIQAASPPTFGSGAIKYGPDVFTGPLQVSMSLTMLRKSLAIFSDFVAEQPYTLDVLAVDNMSEPKDFISITVPNFTLGGVDPSALSKAGGGRTQTITIPAGLVGIANNPTAGFDNTMIGIQTTAA